MTKIKLPDWLGLPFMAHHALEQMNIEDFVDDPVMKSGILYHPVKVKGNIAKLLQHQGEEVIYVQASDKEEAVHAAMASLKTGKKFITSSMAIDNTSTLQEEYERRLSTSILRQNQERASSAASLDEQVYTLIKSGLKPSDIVAKGLLPNQSQVQQAYGRQVVRLRKGDEGLPGRPIQRRALEESETLNVHIKEIRSTLTRMNVPHNISFVPDNSGGHFRITVTDGSSMYGTPIKLSEAKGTLLINKEGRNGYRAINAMTIASETVGGVKSAPKLYGNGTPKAVSEAIATAISQQYSSYLTPGRKTDALVALNMNRSISSTEGKTYGTWVDNDIVQSHSEFGALAKITNVPQGMFPLSTGDHSSQIYGKGGAFPIENLSAVPGTSIQRDRGGRIVRVIGDDPLTKHIKRTRLQAQDYVEIGYSPTQAYTPATSRVKASGEQNFPQGYRAKQAFFLQAVLEEGAGIIDKTPFPYIMTSFSDRPEKFKIAITSDEQKADLIAKINGGLSGEKGLAFLKSNGLKSSSWGGAAITGYEERDGYLYLQGSLYQETGGNMAIKSGQKAHFYNQSPRSLGVEADLATNAPSSQRQMMTIVLGSMDKSTLNRYWQQVHGTNAPDKPSDIDQMTAVYKEYAKDHTTNKMIVKTISEQRMKEFGSRIKEWTPIGETPDGEKLGRAVIETSTLITDVLFRPKGEFSKRKSRLTSAEGGIFQKLYPDTYNRLLADSEKGREKYDIIEQINRYNLGMLKQGMMPVVDLKEMMATHGTELIKRANELASFSPEMSRWEQVAERKRARAQAVNEFAPGYLLKYGKHHMGQSANFAHLAFETEEGRMMNPLGDSTDDFLDNLFNQHLGLKGNRITLPAHEAGKKNVYNWDNPNEVARQVSDYQARQIDAYGTRMKSTDISTPLIQYHTYTSDSGLGANEFARSYYAMSRLMGIKQSDPMYQVMKKAMERGLITGTSWRSPGVNPVAQMGNVLRSVGQRGLRERGIDIDLGRGMGAVYSPYHIYSQGGDNDSDADKFVVHTQLKKIDFEPTKEQMKRDRRHGIDYIKHKGEWYSVYNPYEVSSPQSIIKKGEAHSAGEAEGWRKKAKMSPEDAFKKLLPKDESISSTELSLGSFEHKQQNSKQIGYVYDIFTKAIRSLVHPSIQPEAGSLAGRYYQPPLDNNSFKRAEPIANMIEYINSLSMRIDKEEGGIMGSGKVAQIDRERGVHGFRTHMESLYQMSSIEYKEKDGTLSFASNDAPGHKMNPLVLQFIREYAGSDLRKPEEIRASAVQKLDKDGKPLPGVYIYSLKPDNLLKAKNAAYEIKGKLEALLGFAGQDGYLANRIYTGYDEKEGSDYESMHQWLTEGLVKDKVEWGRANSQGQRQASTPMAMMRRIDELLGYDPGRMAGEFKNSLFSRTSSRYQIENRSKDPIETMLTYVNSVVGGLEKDKGVIAKEFASIITPNNLAEGLTPTASRDLIASQLEQGDFAELRKLLDSHSQGGNYLQSDSPLNVVTRATTVRNMRKEVMKQSKEIQAEWMRLRQEEAKKKGGKVEPVNDMSAGDFYEKYVLPNSRPKWFNNMPDYIQAKFASIASINDTLVQPDMKPYLADEARLKDIVQAQSLNKAQGHKWFGSVQDYFRNEALQRQGLVAPLLGKDESLQTVAKPKPSIVRANQFVHEEEAVWGEEENPFANDSSGYGGDEPPPDLRQLARQQLAGLIGVPETWQSPQLWQEEVDKRELYDLPTEQEIAQAMMGLKSESAPVPRQKPDESKYMPTKWESPPVAEVKPEPLYEQYRTPQGLWYEKRPGRAVRISAKKVRPEVLERYNQPPVVQPRKDNIAASQLIASGSVMLLNMLEKSHITARRESIDSEVGVAIKQRATEMMKARGDYQSFMGARMDFDGGSISGNIDLVSLRDGVAEMIDLSTTSSEFLAEKQAENGLRTIAKAKLLSNVEGFGNVPIHARTVTMSPEMQARLREYKKSLNTNGLRNQALIDEFATHLVEQASKRQQGDTQRYEPSLHDPLLAQGYNDALARRDIAKKEFEQNFANLPKGTLKEGLFSDLLKRLPQFARGGMLFDTRSQTSHIRLKSRTGLLTGSSYEKGRLDAYGKAKLGMYKVADVSTRVLDWMDANLPDPLNPFYSRGAILDSGEAQFAFRSNGDDIKGVGGEDGREWLVHLKDVQKDKAGNLIFDRNSAIELTEPTMIPDGNWLIAPETKASIVGDVIGVNPKNLGKPHHEKPTLKLFADGEKPGEIPPNQPPLITTNRLEPRSPKKAEIPIVPPNGSVPPPSNASRPPQMMFEPRNMPSMIAEIAKLGQATEYYDRMLDNYKTLQQGGLPETPDPRYASILSNLNKYWDKLPAIERKANAMLDIRNLERDFRTRHGDYTRFKEMVRAGDITSHSQAEKVGIELNMHPDKAMQYYGALKEVPFSVNKSKALLATKLLEQIQSTREKFSSAGRQGDAARALGLIHEESGFPAPLGGMEDWSFLGASLHGMMSAEKGRMTMRDKDEADRLKDQKEQDKEQLARRMARDKFTSTEDRIALEGRGREEGRAYAEMIQSAITSTQGRRDGAIRDYKAYQQQFRLAGVRNDREGMSQALDGMKLNAGLVDKLNLELGGLAQKVSNAKTIYADNAIRVGDLSDRIRDYSDLVSKGGGSQKRLDRMRQEQAELLARQAYYEPIKSVSTKGTTPKSLSTDSQVVALERKDRMMEVEQHKQESRLEQNRAKRELDKANLSLRAAYLQEVRLRANDDEQYNEVQSQLNAAFKGKIKEGGLGLRMAVAQERHHETLKGEARQTRLTQLKQQLAQTQAQESGELQAKQVELWRLGTQERSKEIGQRGKSVAGKELQGILNFFTGSEEEQRAAQDRKTMLQIQNRIRQTAQEFSLQDKLKAKDAETQTSIEQAMGKQAKHDQAKLANQNKLGEAQLRQAAAQESYDRAVKKAKYYDAQSQFEQQTEAETRQAMMAGRQQAIPSGSSDLVEYARLTKAQRQAGRKWLAHQQQAINDPNDLQNIQEGDLLRRQMQERKATLGQLSPHIADERGKIRGQLSEAKEELKLAHQEFTKAKKELFNQHRQELDSGNFNLDFSSLDKHKQRVGQATYQVASLEQQLKYLAPASSQPIPSKLTDDVAVKKARDEQIQADKRAKLDSSYRFKQDMASAAQAGSTQGRGLGLIAPAQELADSNARAMASASTHQAAYEQFVSLGGMDKPAKEWSRATLDAARTMDEHAKIVRDLNVKSDRLVKATASHIDSLKSANAVSEERVKVLTDTMKFHEKQRDTYSDKGSVEYRTHEARRAIAENDLKAETAKIASRKAQISEHQQVLQGQTGNLQQTGVEKKLGLRGHATNAIMQMTDLQNMFYASSSLANYGYMIGSPLLQARQSYIADEYMRSKISALSSPDGFSKRDEMVSIRQQQSAGEDAYYRFSKGVYKGLEPIYDFIGRLSRQGSDSGLLENAGYYAPMMASGLTMGVLGKMATPIVGGAMTLAGGSAASAGSIVGGAMLAGATIPGLYNTVMRGDALSVLGYEMPFGIGKGVSPFANKNNDDFWSMASNQAGKLDFLAKFATNVSKYGLSQDTWTMTGIESMNSGWWSGSMGGFSLTDEQAQAKVDELNKNRKGSSTFDTIATAFGRSTYNTFVSNPYNIAKFGYDAFTLDPTGITQESTDKAWSNFLESTKRDFGVKEEPPKFELETHKISTQDRVAGQYSDEGAKAFYGGQAGALTNSVGNDQADRIIRDLVNASVRTANGKTLPTISEGDAAYMANTLMDSIGLMEGTPEYKAYSQTMIDQIMRGNTTQETAAEAVKMMNASPFSPGSAKNATAVNVLNAPQGEAPYSDAERQSKMEAYQMIIAPLENLGLADNAQAVNNMVNKFANIRNEKGQKAAMNEMAKEMGFTPGDMVSRTPYYWSMAAREGANFASPEMKEATRSLQLVDDKGRETGFFEKRAAQDKDTRFKNEMELGAQYKQVAFIDPLSGETQYRQEITGFEGGEMQRKLNSMMRDLTQTFGTISDLATKFGQSETYTADGEGARWKDNRREKYGLDMTGYSDNLVSKTDYQYTMMTKGHDLQMQNYALQLDQIDLNLKKQKESFEMSKEFGEKQKAIQLELFNLETKYKYEDLEIARGKANKQYGRQMEDFATQRARLGVTHGWKMDDFDTQEYRTEVQRGWQLQDNSLNREMFDLQSGWQSDDFERNIRYSSGRQRIDMKRQYERQLIMNNLKREQMYNQEQRQVIQHGWSIDDINKNRGREDTQFGWGNADIDKGEKRAGEDFATAIADIDRAKARLDETIPLQRELIELSNEYWKLQMDFQSKYMKEEEEMAKRQKAQIEEKMALEQWQFEQQMGWFEIDRKYQEEKARKDIEIFTAQKTHAEEMAKISENLLKIDREREVATVAFNTQLHLGFVESSKIYAAMGGIVERANIYATNQGKSIEFIRTQNRLLEEQVAILVTRNNVQNQQPAPTTRPGGADNNPNTPFATGGYTGNVPKTQVVGVVHGQEYVIPAQGSPVLREPQVVNLLSAILEAIKGKGDTQVVLDGEVISKVVDRTLGNHFNNAYAG